MKFKSGTILLDEHRDEMIIITQGCDYMFENIESKDYGCEAYKNGKMVCSYYADHNELEKFKILKLI